MVETFLSIQIICAKLVTNRVALRTLKRPYAPDFFP